MGVINKIIGTHSERELKRHKHTLDKVLALKPEMEKLTDDEMRAKTEEFKKRYAEGETLDDLLPEAFALVREATRRTLGTEHYPCQIMGGIILHQGRIAEMKTGEGKTQTCLLPAYLNAWSYDYEGGSNVIDVYIRYLRKKIDAGYEKKLIHTVRGTGYVMREE